MRYKQDLVNFLGDNLLAMVESHFELWKDHYFRMTDKDVLFQLTNNYDFSGDLEYVADCLHRELTTDEQSYIITCFENCAYRSFYKNHQKLFKPRPKIC